FFNLIVVYNLFDVSKYGNKSYLISLKKLNVRILYIRESVSEYNNLLSLKVFFIINLFACLSDETSFKETLVRTFSIHLPKTLLINNVQKSFSNLFLASLLILVHIDINFLTFEFGGHSFKEILVTSMFKSSTHSKSLKGSSVNIDFPYKFTQSRYFKPSMFVNFSNLTLVYLSIQSKANPGASYKMQILKVIEFRKTPFRVTKSNVLLENNFKVSLNLDLSSSKLSASSLNEEAIKRNVSTNFILNLRATSLLKDIYFSVEFGITCIFLSSKPSSRIIK
ncbi:hypothetical protein AGLY_001468, partial [Aphis glycines]